MKQKMSNEVRLIDANDLSCLIVSAKCCLGKCVSDWLKGYRDALQAVLELVGEAPTVDATPIVHGFWKKNWHDNDLIGHEYEECSACGSCIISDTEKFWDCNYCPNCGAKMDGDGNG